MACSRTDESILYLYGEGPAGFEAHLAECRDCSEFVMDSGRTLALYRSVASGAEWARATSRSSHAGWFRIGLAAAASLLIIWGTASLVRKSSPGPMPGTRTPNSGTPVVNSELPESLLNVDRILSQISIDSVRVLSDGDSSRVMDLELRRIRSSINRIFEESF